MIFPHASGCPALHGKRCECGASGANKKERQRKKARALSERRTRERREAKMKAGCPRCGGPVIMLGEVQKQLRCISCDRKNGRLSAEKAKTMEAR